MTRVRLPVLTTTGGLAADGSRPRILPADVHGRFTRARRVLGVLLIAFAGCLPWVKVHGAPALFLDIDGRRLFAFGATFNAQDGALIFLLLTGLGFSLVLVTSLFGRLWCGWTCPQTVLLDGVFRPVERLIEGSREARMRREADGWSVSRALRLGAKHAIFVIAAVAIAHGTLAYFVSVPGVLGMIHGSPSHHVEAFGWTAGFSVALYADLAIFREQLCLGVCPYGRLQGALVDDDTVTIGYDARRGEPRGKAGHVEGACLDCNRCVVVCPTGIDIRNGLQLDCIGCAACVDACDDVMARAHRPRGLIRYDSLRGLGGEATRFLRPRVLGYGVLLAIGSVVAVTATSRRHTDAELTVGRLRGAPFQIEGERVTNAFDVHLVSKRSETGVYDLKVEAPPSADVTLAVHELSVDAMGSAHAPLFVSLPRDAVTPGAHVHVTAVRRGSSEVIASDIGLLGGSR